MPEDNVISQITNKEGLTMFYNEHLRKFLAHKINAVLFSELKPNDVVRTVVVPSGNAQIPGMERKIKAKDVLIAETKKRNDQEHILRIIKRLIKEEK